MTTYVGGIRLRLIKDSFYEMVNQALDDRGWFDSNRRHKPIEFLRDRVDPDDQIIPNKISLATDDMLSYEAELGSGLEENVWAFSLDIFAESDDLGLELAGEIRDILRGKIPSIGRSEPSFSVLDYTAASPSHLFYCEIQEIEFGKIRNTQKPYNRYWWTVVCDVIDYYADEED